MHSDIVKAQIAKRTIERFTSEILQSCYDQLAGNITDADHRRLLDRIFDLERDKFLRESATEDGSVGTESNNDAH